MSTPASARRFLENLFRSSEADLRHYVRSRSASIGADDVDDIVQESFLRISSLESHDSIRNPRGFLFRTARNLLVDKARKRSVRAAAHLPFEMGYEAQNRASKKLSPECQVSAQQELDVVLKAIDDLPDRCRRVFLLQRRNNYTYAKVAEILDISESMVQKHMRRALVQLYKALPR